MLNSQGHILLPLETLLISLEREGFSFGVDVHLRMQTVLQSLGKEYVRKPEKLKHILSPILVKTQEESLKFGWIFDEYIEKVVRPYIHQQLHPEEAQDAEATIRLDPELRKHVSIWKRLFPLFLIMLFGGAALGLFLIQNESSELRAKPDFSILSATNELLNDKHIDLGERITLRDKSGDYLRNLLGRELTEEIETGVQYLWDMGDGTQKQGNELDYTYQEEGLYLIKHKLIIPIEGGQKIDSVEHAVWVKCKEKPRINRFVLNPPFPRIGENFKIEIEASGVDPESIIWIVDKNGEFNAGGDFLNREGVHTLEPRMISIEGGSCSMLDTLFYVQILNKNHYETLLEPENTDIDDKGASSFTYSFTYATTLLPTLLLFGLVYLIDYIRLKRRREKLLGGGIEQNKENRLGPYEIPWPDMNYLLSADQHIYRLSKILRQRRAGERKKLNISSTLKATVRALGMLDLKYSGTSKSSEYLILIEQKHPQSHLTRLFDRFTHLLKDENVELERFYFDSDMRVCWNEDFPKGIPLTRLRQRFPNHRLLLYTDGYHMLDAYEAKLKDWVSDALEIWKKRVMIVSPVPPTDWGYKEKILFENFSLLSAQLADQDRILEFYTYSVELDFESHRNKSLSTQSLKNESLKDYDFEQIEDLRIYLNDALFEWLSATMVYPQPNWELALAIGRALSQRTAEASLLSYENLLRLSRIPWMQDGLLPPRLRKELLNQLDRETEHIARETVLDVLEEVEVKQNSYASKKLNVQQISNHFLTSPVDEEIAQKMYVLWQNNQIADSAVLKWLDAPMVQLNGEKPSTYLKTRFERITPLWTLSKSLILACLIAFGTYLLHKKYDTTDTLKKLSETYHLDKFYLTESVEQLDSAVYYNDMGVEAFKSGDLKAARVHFFNAIQFRHYKKLKETEIPLSFEQSRKEPFWNVALKVGGQTSFTDQKFSVQIKSNLAYVDSLKSAFDFDTLLLGSFVPANLRINDDKLIDSSLLQFDKYPQFDDNVGLLPAFLFVQDYPLAGKNLLNLTMYNEGVSEFNNGNYSVALAHFDRDALLLQGALQEVDENLLKPLYTKILHGVGLCYFYLGQKDSAISYKNRIIQQDSSFFVNLEKPREHLVFLLERGLNQPEEEINEDEMWAQVEIIGTILAYESYLESFPNGKYEIQAKETIDKLSLLFQFELLGTVKDEDGEPLEGVSIILNGTDEEAQTDVNGTFSLNIPEGNHEIIALHSGYITQQIELTSEYLQVVLVKEETKIMVEQIRQFRAGRLIRALTFSPNSKSVLVGSWDKIAKLFDLEGNQIQVFGGHTSAILGAAFSPDSRFILTGGHDNKAVLWDLEGNVIREFLGHTGWISSVAYAPNGKFMVTGSADSSAIIWDTETSEEIDKIETEEGVLAVDIYPNLSATHKYVLLGTVGGGLLVNLQEGTKIKLSIPGSWVNGVAFSPDGQLVATVGKDNAAKLWNLNGKLLRSFTGHTGQVFSVAFSHDGKYLLTGADDNTAILWDMEGNAVKILDGHSSWVRNVAFSPDGKYIATGSGDNTVILWSFKD